MTSASTRESFYVYGGEAEVAYEYKNYDDSWEPTDSSTSFSISGSSRWTATSWTSRWTTTDRIDFARHGAPAARTVP